LNEFALQSNWLIIAFFLFLLILLVLTFNKDFAKYAWEKRSTHVVKMPDDFKSFIRMYRIILIVGLLCCVFVFTLSIFVW